jgi:hypothetical protein
MQASKRKDEVVRAHRGENRTIPVAPFHLRDERMRSYTLWYNKEHIKLHT